VAEPVTESTGRDCGTNTDNRDGHCTVRVAHISQAGDYAITTNGKVTPDVNPRLAFGHPSRFWFVTRLFVGLCVFSLAALFVSPMLPGDSSGRDRVRRLLDEAGVSRARQRTTRVVGRTLRVLAALGSAVFLVGVVVNDGAVWKVGLALFLGSFALMVPLTRARVREIEKVRWQDGTVTFRTVEFRGDDDDGWDVDCEVELNPPGRITRVSTAVSGTGRARFVVGATMCCQFDRTDDREFRAFPDAGPEVPLPSGKKLSFRERKSPK
jgi:hypothetical protein